MPMESVGIRDYAPSCARAPSQRRHTLVRVHARRGVRVEVEGKRRVLHMVAALIYTAREVTSRGEEAVTS